jgi:predicted methyltransferase
MDFNIGPYLIALLSLSVCPIGRTEHAPLTVVVDAAVSDPRRPEEQVKLDVTRKPGLSVLFSGAKAGDRIADLMSGNGYFTRILSDVVGPRGRVYAYLPVEQIAHCAPGEIVGTQEITRDPSYRNVILVTGPLADFRLPERLDLIWMSQSYHDLHDAFLGPPNVAVLNKAIFDALKPGGVFLVIDHIAEADSGLRDTETLHRIDPIRMKNEIEMAGFVLEAQSDVLRNTADDHKLAIFDPSIRGRTDQVLFRFRKPQQSAGPRSAGKPEADEPSDSRVPR